jgi:hypothetical protein
MWQRFVVVFLMTLCLGGSTAFGFILLVDPYDRGQPGLGWLSGGIVDEDPRTASASRGRDRRFDSAVIGNSHGQMIDPARLSSGSGLNFVQLTVPGTGPREQLTLLRWFMGHHHHIGAIVLAADDTWCTQDPALPITNPFPFWLYTDNDAEYAVNALRTAALDRGWRRLLLALGLRHESDPTGFADYERGRVWAFAPTVPEGLTPASGSRNPQRPFPAIVKFSAVLRQLPADARLIVVFPPVFVTELPTAGSDAAEWMAECKGAFSWLVDGRGTLIDFAVDGELVRDPRNFMDATHYRADLAGQLDDAIVAILGSPRR